MTISEKKIELVQGLLLLQDKATLFEIEKLFLKKLLKTNPGSLCHARNQNKTAIP